MSSPRKAEYPYALVASSFSVVVVISITSSVPGMTPSSKVLSNSDVLVHDPPAMSNLRSRQLPRLHPDDRNTATANMAPERVLRAALGRIVCLLGMIIAVGGDQRCREVLVDGASKRWQLTIVSFAHQPTKAGQGGSRRGFCDEEKLWDLLTAFPRSVMRMTVGDTYGVCLCHTYPRLMNRGYGLNAFYHTRGNYEVNAWDKSASDEMLDLV